VDDSLPGSLEHPLPAGMRDLLPDEAASRRRIARAALDRFALHGYRVVTPPAFELADVVERGLGRLTADDVLRFIEPESGEVVVLRPDMTPQIARIVATRLRDRPPPYRLAYEGTVVRRRLGRAKKHRQIPQVGVELCGPAAREGDLELLDLAVSAVRATGLSRFTIELADAGIVRELLTGVPLERARAVTAALARKDDTLVAEAVTGLPEAERLRALARLHGGRDALVEADALLAGTPSAPAVARLLALFDAASARGLAAQLAADAGEVRGLAYYTGTIFSLYASGPGDAFGGGGRYDELLSRFGRAMPAAGFGLDIDALAVALRDGGAPGLAPAGVVVVGGEPEARLRALRALGIAAVSAEARVEATPYARAWGHALIWEGAEVEVVASGVRAAVSEDPTEGARAAARVLETVSRGV
jgi:ATP phosphoribosyltransferase regulatory subunit